MISILSRELHTEIAILNCNEISRNKDDDNESIKKRSYNTRI